MFGSVYFNYPEILIQSLGEMNKQYKNTVRVPPSPLIKKLQSLYIRLFGIPEIGFQIRGMYFYKALKTIKNFKPDKILDAGSGIGIYSYNMAKLFPSARIDGWEIDKRKLSFTKKFSEELQINNTHFIYRDITKKQKKHEAYDFIVTIDVLEHVTDYKNALKNFYNLLKRGGYAYIHIPQTKQKRFFSKFKSWKHENHIREGFETKKMLEELETIGFRIVFHEYTFGFLGSLTWELNHLLISKSFILAGLAFPILYIIALIDSYTHNKEGLATSYLVQKP